MNVEYEGIYWTLVYVTLNMHKKDDLLDKSKKILTIFTIQAD